MFVWLLATNMPLIMLVLWSAVAAEAPVGRYGQREFAAYFLSTLVVRLLTGAWVVWTMNLEIKNGQLAMRLIRPVHPFWMFAAENVAAWPLRAVMAVPIGVAAVWMVGGQYFTRDLRQWALFPIAVLSAWLLNFSIMLVIGCLAFFWQSSFGAFEVWFRLYIVFSGYVVPVDLFPRVLQDALRYLPFRYLLAFPVETALGTISFTTALHDLARQWLFISLALAVAVVLWQRGVRRYEAFGG
ncbi:MAG: ABC-2 family transporter protein [Deltaproteobacteria bacterium]|nr:ABC-2 family transporter protein [Deltaproteobacteria bacterium]